MVRKNMLLKFNVLRMLVISWLNFWNGNATELFEYDGKEA